MILVGIDIGKNQHTFSIVDINTGEILSNPSLFNNNQEGFLFLIKKLNMYSKSDLLIGMEDTGHYHFALLKYLLDIRYTVALINPTTTDLTRKLQGGITKNDPLDSLTICDVIGSNQRKKPYRVTKVNRFDLYEQKQLTRHHHNLKEELNTYKNRLQKCIDNRERSGNERLTNRLEEVLEENRELRIVVEDFGRIKAVVGSEQVNAVIDRVKQQEQIEAEQKRAARRKHNREAH